MNLDGKKTLYENVDLNEIDRVQIFFVWNHIRAQIINIMLRSNEP
jgi:hypothetical protein